MQGSAHFDTGGDKTHFTLAASADDVSLPALLGALVAWQRTPSTEEMLGAIGAGTSDGLARARLLARRPREGRRRHHAQREAALPWAPFQVEGATLAARVDKDGSRVTELKGRLFGGTFAASGSLSPRGAGAALKARAELKGGKLDELSKSVVGSVLAKGPFDLAFDVAGEGLSPPGLVAGLSGRGDACRSARRLAGA